ncbi:hypothetical protein RRG08_062563 [Elysia crispata]|uniref:Uncharacterized protein n=1 Tax=Elysia crispata TaxID=231223 RepID=A0AAE1AM43_9GAST|nr:hypothetical protein RRG08_062563 [Elysia crispata]
MEARALLTRDGALRPIPCFAESPGFFLLLTGVGPSRSRAAPCGVGVVIERNSPCYKYLFGSPCVLC